ncbi:MAG: RHS repeat-associated core domain-containing protein [Spirochaetota bacterium]|nr:RHS repeat-associated core domain-containing protein [Spirochaetota bacterium]
MMRQYISSTKNIGLKPCKITGKQEDSETGLYYYGARYLNPRISRWISFDPAGFELINPT